MSSDLVVAMELVGDGAITKWRDLLGPTNCHIARMEAPDSIRAIFGSDGVKNACHGSDSSNILSLLCIISVIGNSAQRELDIFFGEKCRFKVYIVPMHK